VEFLPASLVAAAGRSALFAEQRVYLLALIAFVVLYGLQHMVLSSRAQRRGAVVGEGARDGVYWLHLAGFAAYSGLRPGRPVLSRFRLRSRPPPRAGWQ
jgi:hypothetical protein